MSNTSPKWPPVRKAAVLGAGVMGAQIAAHLTNAGVPTVLFDLPGKKYPNEIVDGALKRLAKLKPSPLATKDVAALVTPANYDEHLALLADCDLVIEAIAERMDWKKDLYDKIENHVADHAILASNTSGLSISELSTVLPESLRPRFCGVHFFNPPRYMALVELIPTATTNPAVLDQLETFAVSALGKSVVRAKDTPNFIGNRIGVFSMLAAMHHTEQFGLGFDVVDALTGPLVGRPKSATYRTADVVGLDTMGHVIGTMESTLSSDPWHEYFGTPDWMSALVEQGALGQKAGAGFYRKEGRAIKVLDLSQQDYRDSGSKPADEVVAILKIKDPGERFAQLRSHESAEAQFLWACFRDLFHYCAFHLADIANNARDLDFAIRWGYGWRQGPFETWQAAGWKQVASWIREDIAAGKAMNDAPLPEWVDALEHGPYEPSGAYSAAAGEYQGRSTLPVYQRQLFPEPVLGERFDRGETVFEDDFARLWHQGDGIAILSFKSKMHTLGAGVIQALNQAIETAEKDYDALVIWQTSEPFCVGADLTGVAAGAQAGDFQSIEDMIAQFQGATSRLKSSTIPTVCAVRGMALGGGCELILGADRTVAALESYIGLVEVGVGLLPGGGGLKEMATRASQKAIKGEVFPHLAEAFQSIAMGKVSGSASEAREMGYLTDSDVIVLNANEVLYVAKAHARALADSGYRPPLPRPVTVAGKIGIANLKMMLVNMLEGHFASEHDVEIGSRIAACLSGGEVEMGSQVDADWLLKLERDHFVALTKTEKTQERIAHMLKTGKPLRN